MAMAMDMAWKSRFTYVPDIYLFIWVYSSLSYLSTLGDDACQGNLNSVARDR